MVFGAQQLLLLVPQAGGGGAFGVSRNCPLPALATSNPPTAILYVVPAVAVKRTLLV